MKTAMTTEFLEALRSETERLFGQIDKRLVELEGKEIGLKHGLQILLCYLVNAEIIDLGVWRRVVGNAADGIDAVNVDRDAKTKEILALASETLCHLDTLCDQEGGFKPVVIPGGRTETT